MTGKLSCNIKYLVLSLLIFPGIFTPLYSQKKVLGGNINNYARVTTIGADYVIVKDDGPNAGQFANFEFSDGDTVLLIQMKGARIYVSEGSSSFGGYEGPIGTPGHHEFLIIDSVESATKRIVFKRNISNISFNVGGDIQLVSVPTYYEAIVNSGLSSAPWDSVKKTGGVLAAIVGRTVTLNADIDVTGKGFLGGGTTIGNGLCAEVPGMSKFAYSATSDSSSFKGESPASRGETGGLFPPLLPRYAKGQGQNFSGGGGSRGKFSGGGGGGNYGAGGTGGREAGGCLAQFPGGLGGREIHAVLKANNALFLGGGGGGPTYQAGATSSPGGNGGGIVILLCDTLKGNSKRILADGATPSVTATGQAGAGGGGGGGSVALYLRHYSDIALSVRGGQGGNNTNIFGDGGGGGGGFIATNDPTSSGTITRSIAGGPKGSRPTGGTVAQPGMDGSGIINWYPRLNGFLFNSIGSAISNSQTDSICSNVIPPAITGTSPVGGSGYYSYTWQKSYNLSGAWSLIPSAISQDYTPVAPEADTFWIRRIVMDDISLLTDTSKYVQINVTPAITMNIVGKDTTICSGQNPLPLVPLNSGPLNGNGHYTYQWVEATDTASAQWWLSAPNASGDFTLSAFDPGAMTVSTYYRRKVISGRCIDFSKSVTVKVLPAITGNITVRPDSVICEGSQFNILNASVPGGGLTGNYHFQWQDSISGGSWISTSAADISATYAPDTSKFTASEKIYFRRIIYSGPDSVCISKSAPIQLTRWHKLSLNSISADQTICSGDTPSGLTGTQPVQGDHINYLYEWQDSSKTGSWTTRASFTSNSAYGPLPLTDTTWYRRIVTSSKCRDTANIVVVNVHDPVTGNSISADTTICSGANPGKIRGNLPSGGNGSFGYQWYSSTDNFVSDEMLIPASGTGSDYDPPALNNPSSFRREVISGACKTKSNIILINVLPSITNNVIAPDRPEVCFNTTPGQITGSALTGGAGGIPVWIWQSSTDGSSWTGISGGNTQHFSPAAGLTQQTWYRRIIKSGPADCCIDTSAVVSIDTLRLPSGSIISVSDTTICNGSEVNLRLNLTGASGWDIVYNENSGQVAVDNISTGNYTVTRIPAATSAMTTYTYTIGSITDGNGCMAVTAGMAGSRKANVWRIPVTEAGPDASVCGPVFTLAAVPSDGIGIWKFPVEVLSGDPSVYNTQVTIDNSYNTPSVTYKFYWEELNGICKSKDSVTITFDNQIESISAGNIGDVMSFDNVVLLTATEKAEWETGEWSLVSGSGEIEDPSSFSTYVTRLSDGANTFKWKVINGTCMLEDLITLNIVKPVIPELISPKNDGINDELEVAGLDPTTQIIDLTIMNGAGSVVFSTTNREGSPGWRNWDGTNSKGDGLPEGTYYYLLKVSSMKVPGSVAKRSGFILLKRQ